MPFAAATQPFVIVDDAGNLTAGSAAKDLSHLFEVDFAIDQNESFDVWIDDISFYNCAGPACLPTCAGPSTPVACPATPGLAAACWPAGTDCAALIALNLISVWGAAPRTCGPSAKRAPSSTGTASAGPPPRCPS